MAAQEEHLREVEGLMAESFGDPQPYRPEGEVTVARDQAAVSVGIPFQPPMPEPLATDFSLWRSRLTQE